MSRMLGGYPWCSTNSRMKTNICRCRSLKERIDSLPCWRLGPPLPHWPRGVPDSVSNLTQFRTGVLRQLYGPAAISSSRRVVLSTYPVRYNLSIGGPAHVLAQEVPQVSWRSDQRIGRSPRLHQLSAVPPYPHCRRRV